MSMSHKRMRELPICEAWEAWLTAMNGLLMVGRHLDERSKSESVDGYGGIAQAMFERITERQVDVAIRSILDEGGT